MNKGLKTNIMLASILAMTGDGLHGVTPQYDRPQKDTNKYKLTPEEIEMMGNMNPKEKKKFLKKRNE